MSTSPAHQLLDLDLQLSDKSCLLINLKRQKGVCFFQCGDLTLWEVVLGEGFRCLGNGGTFLEEKEAGEGEDG